MNDPRLSLRSLELATAKEESAPSSRLAIWGIPVAALVVALLAIGIVSLRGDMVGVSPGESHLKAIIVILSTFAVVVVVHLVLFATGAYGFAARLLRCETGDRTKAAKPLKCDARLQRMAEELRVAHGWFWRSRLRWLMLDGSDERVDQVAPGLKQAGVMHVGETVLVHAAPDGIEKEKWLGQIRKLRSRRPVDGLVHVARADETGTELPRALSMTATALRWAAPVTFLHPVETEGRPSQRFEAVGAFMPNESRRQAQDAAARLPELLNQVEHWSADAGVRLYTRENAVWLMEVSKYVGDHAARIAASLGALAASNWLRAPLAGVMFAPVFPGPTVVPVPVADGNANATPGQPADVSQTVAVTREQPAALLPVWKEIAGGSPRYRGRRAGFYWPDALALVFLIGVVMWTVALVVSGLGNHALVKEAETTATVALEATPGSPQAMRAQLALQQQIKTLEYRRDHGAPWYLRAGLSHNDELLDALWRPYQAVAMRNLRQPVARALEGQLARFSQVRADEQQSHDAQQQAYNRLKAYLMLATPARTDATFLRQQLLDVWPAPTGMRAGEWLDVSQQLAGFWSDHLTARPDWRINPSQPLVTQMRSTLVNQIGLAASDDVLYQRVIDTARG
ncbi:ImcF-related family protein, partial [Paraburkholderia sp. EG287B]|uniref:ImcF-related family protein n=1 Tax=Paraburkholderia sp. EG287B TaxID=3237010 RepID=UPI0034D295E5